MSISAFALASSSHLKLLLAAMTVPAKVAPCPAIKVPALFICNL